jgi:hypothetical protein
MQLRLEIELDFQHTPGEVVVRFYRFADGRRYLLRHQEIFNLAKLSTDGILRDWSEWDQKFLRQILPDLNVMNLLQANLPLLKLSNERLNSWLERWEDFPDRFIERSSQQPYTRNKPRAELKIYLEPHGDRTRLSAQLVGLGGRTGAWHMVRRRLDLRRGEVVIQERIHIIDLPLPPERLDEIFGDGGPTVPTNALVQHLPIVFNGRLDLLTGNAVVRQKNKADIKINLKCDAGDILVNQTPLTSLNLPAVYSLRRTGQRFMVEELEAAEFDTVRQLLLQLKDLRETNQGHFRLTGTPANVDALHRMVQEMPKDIKVGYDEALRGIFSREAGVVVELHAKDAGGWLELELRCRVGHRELSPGETEYALTTPHGVIRARDGSWLRLPAEALSTYRTMLEQHGSSPVGTRLSKPVAATLLNQLTRLPDLRVQKSAQDLADDLRRRSEASELPVPPHLEKILRPYQLDGARFLFQRATYELGCLLADDMGLGKTLQVLTYMQALHLRQRQAGGFLVVCPASVLGVWLREALTFAPGLRARACVGTPAQRQEIMASRTWDLLVVTYAAMRNDIEQIRARRFHTVILDEAQQIKNPDAQVTQAVKLVNATQRIALSGTPLENRLLDLWSIVDFLNPGYLGTREQFRERYSNKAEDLEHLRRRLAPLILRRTKLAVAPELPARTEEVITLPFADDQAKIYAKELAAARAGLQQKGTMELLAAITRLRQICCHPKLWLESVGIQERKSKITADDPSSIACSTCSANCSTKGIRR